MRVHVRSCRRRLDFLRRLFALEVGRGRRRWYGRGRFPIALGSALLAQVGRTHLQHRLGPFLDPELFRAFHPPVELLDQRRPPFPGTRLDTPAIQHHRRGARRRLAVITRQPVRAKRRHLGITRRGPFPTHPRHQPLQVLDADLDLRQFRQIIAGVGEARRLAALANPLRQHPRTVPLGAQFQLLVQGGKRRPDRSCSGTAHVPAEPSRPG